MTTNMVSQVAKEKPPIEVGVRGLILRSLDDMYRFAQYCAASGLAPKGLERPEAILVALEYGLELGLSPAQSLQNIAVINGRPAVWGDSLLALCMAAEAWNHEVFHEWFEGEPGTDDFRACCRVGRRGRSEPIERSFSIGQAKRAGLWGKPGPWQTYPERMLQMRARSWALRDAFPDVLRGCLSAEEAMDIQPPSPQPPTAQSSHGVAGLAAKLGVATQSVPEEAEAAQVSVEPAREAAPAEPTDVVEESAPEPAPEDAMPARRRRRDRRAGFDLELEA